MYRGKRFFKCDNCKHILGAPDFELGATVLSVPQPCKRCGSMHTYPWELIFPNKRIYRKIWEEMDKAQMDEAKKITLGYSGNIVSSPKVKLCYG